jgi:hypothetical protein
MPGRRVRSGEVPGPARMRAPSPSHSPARRVTVRRLPCPCTIPTVQTQPATDDVIPAPDLSVMDAPVRRLYERIAPALGVGSSDVSAVAAAMIDLASDQDYLVGRIGELGGGSGAIGLYAPARGPRLMLVHRREGEMGAIHDHGCWVALAPITGVETHRHFRVRLDAQQVARLELATEVALEAGHAVTMLQPDDTHSHGHVAGTGDPAYVLIMTGDNQRVFRRTEWDTVTGRSRTLDPGDGGRWIDSEPFPLG